MRNGFLGSLAVLAAGAGLSLGQSNYPPAPGSAARVGSGSSVLPAPGPAVGPGAPRAAVPPEYGRIPFPADGDGKPTGGKPGPMGPDGYPPGPGPYGPAFAGPDGPQGADNPFAPYMPTQPMGPDGPDPMNGPDGDPNAGERPRGILANLFKGGYGSRKCWGSVDYLYWTERPMRFQAPVVTTSSASFAGNNFGQLGGQSTAPVAGLDGPVSFDSRNGVRAFIGGTIDEAQHWGGEIGGFVMESFNRQFNVQSSQLGVPVLAVPFVDITTGNQGSYIVSFPGINAGAIRVGVESRAWGAEASGVYNVYASNEGPGGLTLLAGPRFFELRERFTLDTSSTTFGVPPAGGVLGSSFFPGGGGLFAGAFFGPGLAPYSVTTTDRIRTVNDWYGGQVGFRGDVGWGPAFIEFTGKAGLGYNRSYVDLQGASTLGTSVGTDSVLNIVPGGIYNNAQDLGRRRADSISCLIEGGVNVGYYVTPFLRLQAGYTFLYVTNVLRATTSINPYLNPTLIPTSPTFTGSAANGGVPRNQVNPVEFDLHGFNVGLQLTF